MKKLLPCVIFALCLSILSNSVLAQIEKIFTLDSIGEQLTTDQTGRFVYVPDKKNNSLIVIDSTTLEVEQNIALPGAPQDVALDENSGLAFISSNSFSEIFVLDLSSYELQSSVALPQAAHELVVTEHNIFATTFASSSGIMRVDRSINAYVESFSEGVLTYAKGALELTPGSNKLVFANRGLSPATMAVFDLSSGETPELLVKNRHGDLGSNGQNIAVDPVNGAFVSYAVGGGNGAGYTIAKLDINDLSWIDEFTVGAFPRAIHYSIDGYSTYTNRAANSVQVWDSNTFALLENFSVEGNPKDFVDLQGGSLVAVIGDSEFAIYKVKEFTPEPPVAELKGSTNGAELFKVICQNKTSGQRLVYFAQGRDFDCVYQGLSITPGDTIKVVLHGVVQ